MKITEIEISSSDNLFSTEDFTGMHIKLKEQLLNIFRKLDSTHNLLRYVPFGPDKVIAELLRTKPPKKQLLTTYGAAGGVAEGMSFNPRYWKSESALKKVLAENHNQNFLHHTELKSVLAHEYAHILSRNFRTCHKEGSRTFCTKSNGQDAQSAVYELLRDLAPKLGRVWIEKHYGSYGSKDLKEIFAETYQMIISDTLPPELNGLKTILKKEGIKLPKMR